MTAVVATSSRPGRQAVAVIAMAAVTLQLSSAVFVRAQEPAAATADASGMIPPEELDSLVAPIALYPDPLLAPGAGRFHLPARAHPAPTVAQ